MRLINYCFIFLPIALHAMEQDNLLLGSYGFITQDQKIITFDKKEWKKSAVLKNCIKQTYKSEELPILPFSFKTLTEFKFLLDNETKRKKGDITSEDALPKFSLSMFIKLFTAIHYLDCSMLKSRITKALIHYYDQIMPHLLTQSEHDVIINEYSLLIKQDPTAIKELQKHIIPKKIPLKNTASFFNTSVNGSEYAIYDNIIDCYVMIDIESNVQKHIIYNINQDRILRIFPLKNDIYGIISSNVENSLYKIILQRPKENPISLLCLRKINCMSLSPNGDFFLLGDNSGNIYEYNLCTKEIELLTTNNGPISLVRYSPSGSHYVSVGVYGKIMIWDAQTKKNITTLTGKPYDQQTMGNIISFSNNNELAYIGFDDAVHLIDLNSLFESTIYNSSMLSDYTALSDSFDGNVIAVQIGKDRVVTIDIKTKKVINQFTNFAYNTKIGGIFFNDDYSQLKLFDAQNHKMYIFALCSSESYIASLTSEQLFLLSHLAHKYLTSKKVITVEQEVLQKLPVKLTSFLKASQIIRTDLFFNTILKNLFK